MLPTQPLGRSSTELLHDAETKGNILHLLTIYKNIVKIIFVVEFSLIYFVLKINDRDYRRTAAELVCVE